MQSAQDNKDQILNSTVIEPYSDQNYTTRIFAITAMNDEQIGNIYSKYGIEAVFPKPLKMSVLKPIVDSMF